MTTGSALIHRPDLPVLIVSGCHEKGADIERCGGSSMEPIDRSERLATRREACE